MPSAASNTAFAPAPESGKPPMKPVLTRRGSRGLSNCESDGSPYPVDASKLGLPAIKALFREQRGNVDHFWDEIKYEQVQAFAEACVDCKGVICFTGVGKSGFIAHKITQTLVSTGTKAVFLSPTDALHGDIGILSDQDLLVLLFREGDDDELGKLVPYAKAKGAKLLCVSTMHENPLASHCDLNVELPLRRELCPYNMEPVTSTSLQILFGDTVAILLMQARNVTKDEYAMNHPGGKLGKQLMLHVSDIMATGNQVPMVHQNDLVVDVLMELSGKAHGCVVVVDDDDKLCGSFTDGDLRRALLARGEETLELQVQEVMHRSPKTVREDAMAMEAMVFMNTGSRRVSFVPVTNKEGVLTGILTLHMCVAAGL